MTEFIFFLGALTLSAFVTGLLFGAVWLSIFGWKLIIKWIAEHGG